MRMPWKEVLEFSVHIKAGYMRIVSLLLILDSTGQPKICPEFFIETQKPHINSVGLISTQQDQLHTISSTLT